MSYAIATATLSAIDQTSVFFSKLINSWLTNSRPPMADGIVS
jgi:hypothetical protein